MSEDVDLGPPVEFNANIPLPGFARGGAGAVFAEAVNKLISTGEKSRGRLIVVGKTKKKAIIALALVGATKADILRHFGIARQTLRDTLQADPEFLRSFNEARAKCKMMLKKCVLAAAEGGDWKAAAFWLSRKFPREFGENTKTQVDTNIKVKIEYANRPALIECESIGYNSQPPMLDSNVPCLRLEGSTSSSAEEGGESPSSASDS